METFTVLNIYSFDCILKNKTHTMYGGEQVQYYKETSYKV